MKFHLNICRLSFGLDAPFESQAHDVRGQEVSGRAADQPVAEEMQRRLPEVHAGFYSTSGLCNKIERNVIQQIKLQS